MNRAFIEITKSIMKDYVILAEEFGGEDEVTFEMKDVNMELDGVRWEVRIKEILSSYGYNVDFTYGDGHWTTIHHIN